MIQVETRLRFSCASIQSITSLKEIQNGGYALSVLHVIRVILCEKLTVCPDSSDKKFIMT